MSCPLHLSPSLALWAVWPWALQPPSLHLASVQGWSEDRMSQHQVHAL